MSKTTKPADLTDLLLLHRAYAIDHVGISAFLVSLSAWQRGLKVTFHYEVATKSERFANASVQGFRGELFSVSDGDKTLFFRRTLCQLTRLEVSQLCENKQATKECWMAHGIPVPEGQVIAPNPQNTHQAQVFMQRHPCQRFVLKPLDGSLCIGVQLNLSAAQVIEQLKQINTPQLLEVFIPHDYYRVYVVNGEVIQAYVNHPPSVVGNGQHSIRQLVDEKIRTRSHAPLYRNKLKLGHHEARYLAEQGFDFDSVPEQGRRIFINDSRNSDEGADRIDITAQLSVSLRQLAQKAAKALNISFVGLDLLVALDSQKIYALEANQVAMIDASAFPNTGLSPGNSVAEAIIDYYFPNSINNPRYPNASFDFMAICHTLQQGVVSEVSLPILATDWVHQRLQIPKANLTAQTQANIRNTIHILGIHAHLVSNDAGDLIIDILAPQIRFKLFLERLYAKP